MLNKYVKATIFFLLITTDAFSQFSGGSGKPADPYQISEIEQLQEVQNYPDAYFVQVENIDASASKIWNDGKGFKPIVNFTGTYDGANHSITDIFINRPQQNYTAIFAYVDAGTIKNLTVRGAEITGADNSGILAGFSINGRISNIKIVESNLTGGTHTGGLIGFNFGNTEDISVS